MIHEYKENKNTLQLRLKSLIAKKGPISLKEYMAISAETYYSNETVFGKEGDFITAPEISQVFGELIGLWSITAWKAMGKPERFSFVELGPGRGVLMADALRAINQTEKSYLSCASIHMIEKSQKRKMEQKAILEEYDITWHSNIYNLPKGPIIIIGNEFIDAIPIKQFIKKNDKWFERLVGFDNKGLHFKISNTPEEKLKNKFQDSPDNTILETSNDRDKIIRLLAQTCKNGPGITLILDYGYTSSRTGDTLQAVKKHSFSSILNDPGKTDLTAHVNFHDIEMTAKLNNNRVFGPISQGKWLKNLGVNIRRFQLMNGKSNKEKQLISSSIDRLITSEQMGEIFKVIAFSSSKILEVEGFN